MMINSKTQGSIIKFSLRFMLFFSYLITSSCHTGSNSKMLDIVIPPDATKQELLAAKQLNGYLQQVFPSYRFNVTTSINENNRRISIGLPGQLSITDTIKNMIPEHNEGFLIHNLGEKDLIIVSRSDKGLFNAVYSLLEKLGFGFYLSYEGNPEEKKELLFSELAMSDYPLQNKRIVFDWHNFLSGCTGWSYEEWCSWIDQSAKMKYNSIMVHAYGNNPMFSFEYNGLKKEVGYLTTSISGRDWGAVHIKDIRRLPGGEIFSGPVLGSQAAMVPDEHRGEAATSMMARVFEHAGDMAMRIIFAIDVDTWSANPKNIIESLPRECRIKLETQDIVDPESADGYKYYRAQVISLLKSYPQISTLCVWVRPNNTLWRNIKPAQFNKSWQEEWSRLIVNHPEIGKDKLGASTFALSKIVVAFQKALKEINRDDVEVAFGSWGWDFLPSAGVLLPENCALIPLDSKIIFDTEETKTALSGIGTNRELLPVVWAHHDDHRYFGRPYAPYSNFNKLLEERNASGYGIIHWTTRPLDIYFKGLGDQVWKNSENKSLASILTDYCGTIFGSTQTPLLDYMTEWILRGPMFGRETSEHFFDLGKQQFGEGYEPYEVTLNLIRKRTEMLMKVNQSELSVSGRKMFDYYSSMELFYESLFRNQEKFNVAYSMLGRQSIDSAKSVLETVDPEKTIELYTKASTILPVTMGEKAVIVSMGTRWLPDFDNLKQRAGMIDICYKFEATQHDSLAQYPGTATFFIDDKKVLWSCKGEKEIKGGITGVFDGKEAAGLPGNSLTYMEFSTPFTFPLVTFGKNQPAPGKYKLEIRFAGSSSDTTPCKLFLAGRGSRIPLKIITSDSGSKLTEISSEIEISGSEKYSVEIDPGNSGIRLTNLIIKPEN